MTKERNALRMALVITELRQAHAGHANEGPSTFSDAADMLEALAQTSDSVKQEPVGTFFVQHWRGLENQHFDADGHGLPDGEYKLYTTPPKRQPLTDEQIADYLGDTYLYMTQYDLRFFKLGEKAAHGIKETT